MKQTFFNVISLSVAITACECHLQLVGLLKENSLLLLAAASGYPLAKVPVSLYAGPSLSLGDGSSVGLDYLLKQEKLPFFITSF